MMELWKQAHVLRTLAEAGHADLAEPVRTFLQARQRVEPGALDRLLSKPQEHALVVDCGYLVGPDGSHRHSPGLRVLIEALQARGPIAHGFGGRLSAERSLLTARKALAKVDKRLEALVRPPIVRDKQVRVLSRVPVLVSVVEAPEPE